VQVEEVEELLKYPLMQHQRVAVKAFLELKRLLLADQMGVGKTLPALATAQYLRKTGTVNSCLVVCIASVKRNWVKEIEKFLKEPDYIVIEGAASEREAMYGGKEFFKIVNYEVLRNDVQDFLFDSAYDIIIVDEIHRIRTHNTKQTKAVVRLGKKAQYRWGLTGTPIHNKLEDLYSIMKFIDEGILGNWWKFDQRYIEHGYFGEVVGYTNTDEVKEKLGYFMLRRKKEDVLKDLPPKIYNVIHVELSKEQRKFYENCKKQIVEMADEEKEEKVNQANVLAKTTYIREVCDSAELVDPERKVSTKMKELQEVVTEFVSEGRKVVIFTQFAKMAMIIGRDLKERSIILHGGISTSGTARQDLIDRFEKDEAIPVFITTTAGGEGINLQFANVVIFFDLPFNPQVVAQMEDRLHRAGQTNSVNVIKLVAKDTIEERVCEILERKIELFERVVEGVRGLSTRELLKLL
jgi:SNF2 family DNA or RNA helicase